MDENEAVDPIMRYEMDKDEFTDSIPLPNGIASMTVSRNGYEELIHNACKEVKDIEDSLREVMREKRTTYFNDELERSLSDWKNERNDVQTIWRVFMSAINKIKEAFRFKNAYVFGEGKTSSTSADKKKKMLKSNGIAQEAEKPCFDFEKFANDFFKPFAATSSLHDSSLLDGVDGIEDKENLVVLAFPNIVVTFEVESLKAEVYTYEVLFTSIAGKLPGMISRLELLTTTFLKEHHELTLRMYRHEAAHIAERLSDRNNLYLGSDKNAKQLTGSTREKVYEDFRSSIILVSNMALTIGIVLGRLSEDEKEILEEESIRIFGELLYKWEAMFSNKLKYRNLEIVVHHAYSSDPNRPSYIKINRDLFELLIFNLVDNAVKYAYRGTSIFIDCVKEGMNYVLKVTSLGPKMDNGDEPYGLYTRGVAEEQDMDVLSGRIAGGDGLGLYIVRRICSELLDLEVSHYCHSVPVADINVPLIDWYRNLVPQDEQGPEIKKRLQDYNHQYKHRQDYSEQWFNPKNKITRTDLSVQYLKKRILSKIYQTTFKVLIPISREN